MLNFIIFYGIPLATLVFFVVSLFRFVYAKIRNKRESGCYTVEEIKERKVLLIVSSVIAGVLVGVLIAFIAVLSMAVVNM